METVGKPLTILSSRPRHELGPWAGGMSLSGNETFHSKSQDVVESASAAMGCREPLLENKQYQQLSPQPSVGTVLNFMTGICLLAALGERFKVLPRHPLRVGARRSRPVRFSRCLMWLHALRC